MEWLNYHHLLYFWMVAREGSVTKAGERLRLAQPTVTGQIRALERALGEKLFVKSGRRLALTEAGRVAYRYASEIFGLGREMTEALKGRGGGRPMRLLVGVSDALPKLIAYRLLEPALKLEPPVQLVCYEDQPERLLAELSTFGLDLVLADAPVGAGARVRAYSHLLGRSGITFFAKGAVASRYRRGFPGSLDGAPVLLPLENAAVRRPLEEWLEKVGARVRVVGEFQDSALLKAFGEAGAGLFAAPTAVERDVTRQYGVRVVGRTEEVTERFYAITVERKLRHPAAVAISESARERLFGGGVDQG